MVPGFDSVKVGGGPRWPPRAMFVNITLLLNPSRSLTYIFKFYPFYGNLTLFMLIYVK
jgi:hypothetical protein